MSKCKSFTLLETLIAITILSVGLLAVLGLITYTLSVSRASPEEIIAVNLAQEGIEVVRNIRDSNWLDPASPAWDSNIPTGDFIPIFTGSGAAKNNNPSDVDTWVLDNVGGGGGAGWKKMVYYDALDYFYGQSDKQVSNTAQFPDNWELTKFTRWITINKPNANQIQVICTVVYTDRSGNNHTITLEDHLYDWKQP